MKIPSAILHLPIWYTQSVGRACTGGGGGAMEAGGGMPDAGCRMEFFISYPASNVSSQ